MLAIGDGTNFKSLLVGLSYKDLDRLREGLPIDQIMPPNSPIQGLAIIAGPTDEELKARVAASARAAGKDVNIEPTIDRHGRPAS